MARLIGKPFELVEFHVWYLKAKGWVERLDTGQLSISALGVDQVEKERLRLPNDRLLTAGSDSESAGGETTRSGAAKLHILQNYQSTIKPRVDPELRNGGTRAEAGIYTLSAGMREKASPVILVVEDEPVTQKLIKKIFEDRGYAVVIAEDGIDALMELGKRDFDLILSDLSMPNLDGFRLLEFINMKSIKASVIFLTGSDNLEEEIKLLALGAKDYIRKPINKDLLLLRVSKVLHESA